MKKNVYKALNAKGDSLPQVMIDGWGVYYPESNVESLKSKVAELEEQLASAKADGIRESMHHVANSYTEDSSEWVIGANAIIARFAKYVVKLTNTTIDKGE